MSRELQNLQHIASVGGEESEAKPSQARPNQTTAMSSSAALINI
jgi:hypothetical protein